MECARQRSFATWRLHIFRQLALSPQPRLPRRSLASSRAQLAEADEAASPEHGSSRATSKDIPPSQRLPQSPVLTYLHRGKKQRKRQPTREDLEPLAKNPWAVALASPVRLCTLTEARLPRDLLGEWSLVPRPGTESLYMLPVGVLNDHLRDNEVPVPRATPVSMATGPSESDGHQNSSGESPDSGTPAPSGPPSRRLVLRISDHHLIHQVLSKRLPQKSAKTPLAARLIPARWRQAQGPITPREQKNIVWRKDMPEFMLESMRKNVVKKLESVYLSYPTLGAQDGVWNVLGRDERTNSTEANETERLKPFDRMECGVVLSQSPPESLHQRGDLSLGNEIQGDVWTLPGTHKYVPNLNLSGLLGSHLVSLREGVAARHFQNPNLFFRPDDAGGIEALLALCRLQHYLYQREGSAT